MSHVSDSAPGRVNGSLLGKYAILLVYDDALEIRTLSTVGMIACLWVLALGVFFLSAAFLGMAAGSVITLAAGIAAFFLMTRCWKGKLAYRFPYTEVVSFVTDGPEFSVNTVKNQMYSVRMSGKKQGMICEQLALHFRDNPELRLVRVGEYLRVKPREKAGEA